MRRLAQLAGRRFLGLELGLVALWVGLAFVLSLVTAQVADWNAMTDELVYERLAIAIGETHSVLPRLHGELVRSLAQLYPLSISPYFLHGYVPEDLRNAHIWNAWLMSSACIPAFLLARRVTARRSTAYALALLTVCVPWIVYSTTLLTEVAGYPAFLWAILGMHKALTEPSPRNDVLAVLGLALAFFARTQFLLLAGVLAVALLLHHRARPLDAVRAHGVLAAAYAVLGAAALVVLAAGHNPFYLSVYGSQVSGLRAGGTPGSILAHAADLAFGLLVLPFLVGAAWLLVNAWRRSATRALHAFACIGASALVLVVWVMAAWDLHLGHYVLDRYLYYLAPLVLLAFLAALDDARRPRWSLLPLVALVALGFATHLQEEFTWSGRFPLNTDSPIAWLYRPVADIAGGKSGAAATLAVATVVLAALFVLADRRVRHARVATGLTAVVLVAFPLDTVWTFRELFAQNGHSARPLTRSNAGTLDWLDRSVGTTARVTAVPYPVSSSFFVSQQFWRDLEFWNKSVRYGVHYPTADTYADAVIWFPNNAVAFDARTGAADRTLTPYVVQSVTETRVRIAGVVQTQRPDAMVIDAEQPWRADWLSFGLYDDGWMRPGRAARIRVFAAPRAPAAVTRTLSVQFQPPPNTPSQPFELRSNLATLRGATSSGAWQQIRLCVPAHGFAEVRVTTPTRATIPGDLTSAATSATLRTGGLLVSGISLADEIGPACTPSH